MGRSSFKFQKPWGSRSNETVWITGFWHRFPFLAVLSLFIALASVFGIVGVLIASDGVPIAHFVNLLWKGSSLAVQPQVILSILSTIANIALAFALSKAAVVAWWLRALRGSTIDDLQTSWACSKFFLPRYQNFTQRSWLGLAALLCGIVAIDGPLLQRSSTVSIATIREINNISLPLSPDPFVAGGTGYDSGHIEESTMYTSAFSSVVQAYTNRTPIVIPHSGCTGECNILVEAAGFDVSCNQADIPTNLPAFNSESETSFQDNSITAFNATFSDNTYSATPMDPFLRLYVNTIFKSRPGFTEPFQQHNCVLTENLGEYNITMVNDTVTSIEPWSTLKNSTKMLIPSYYPIVALLDIRSNTIGGFTIALNEKYGAASELFFEGPYFRVLPICNGTLEECNTSIMGPAVSYVNSPDAATGTDNMTWADPIPDILKTIQELSFRFVLETAAQNFTPFANAFVQTRREGGFCVPEYDNQVNYVKACPIENFNQSVHSFQAQNLPVYRTNWSWAAGAISLMLISILSIFPVLFGFWRLGRKFTDSPIEIAKAFGAPLLEAGNSNGSVNSTLSDHGPKKVRYGVAQATNLPRQVSHEEVPLSDFPGPQAYQLHQSKRYSVIINEDEEGESRSVDAGPKPVKAQRLKFAEFRKAQPPMEGQRL